MELEHLRIVIEVARRGSFTAVAHDRNLDPSSISRVVALLEHELGVRLFQRSTRRLGLTEAGAIYLARVEGLVDDLDHARDEALAICSTPIGTLRLTTTVAFGHQCVVPLLPKFRDLYPKLSLELLLTDANLDLVADRVDLAIRLGPSIESTLIYVKLVDTHYRVCASPAYCAHHEPLIIPEDLRDHKCVLFSLPEFRARWFFRDRRGVVQEIPIQGDVIIANPLSLRECALAGMGPVLLANWLIAKDLDQGYLIDLFPDYQVAATTFETAAWLVYPSRIYLPHKVQVMMEFLKQYLG